ncbi:MAG: transposase [Rugosibacter sp.]|nr:transposase [Rugosibacter sp.]
MAKQTKQTKQPKTPRRHHAPEYRTEALGLADRVGVADAAKQLGLHESQIYSWRARARLQQDRGEAEHQMAVENARLKRQLAEQTEELAILKKAAAYFAKHQK